jgi:S1-C subfamily serine protease
LTAELRVLSGALAGAIHKVQRDVIVGRRADADLRFDPQRDLEVSSRHALIGHDGGRWFVRDLGSTNGTFVNGTRVREAPLHDGDRIMFGWQGPEVVFHSTGGEAAPQVSATRTLNPGEVLQQNTRLRWTVGLLTLALGLAVAGAVLFSQRQRSDWEQERTILVARTDSLLAAGDAAVRALAGARAELADTLRLSQSEVRRLRDAMQRTPGRDTAQLPELRRQLQSATAALERQQLAASLDFARIERSARAAVAVIWVETSAGEVLTGTAFAIRPDATLITSRHLVRSADGQGPRRVAIQFSDSDQVWPARVIAVSETGDVAIVKVDNIAGDVPTVHGLNLRPDTLGTGVPVAWIGFPLGGVTWPQDARTGRLARPLGSVGIITRLSTDRIDVQGYGAAGASGSPIFDADGDVIAILIGGRREAAGQTLSGTPAGEIARLLR